MSDVGHISTLLVPLGIVVTASYSLLPKFAKQSLPTGTKRRMDPAKYATEWFFDSHRQLANLYIDWSYPKLCTIVSKHMKLF